MNIHECAIRLNQSENSIIPEPYLKNRHRLNVVETKLLYLERWKGKVGI